MRLIPFAISAVVTVGLFYVLHNGVAGLPPLGPLLSPSHGFWKNAEAADHDFGLDLQHPYLKGKVDVYLDERLVPHIFAESDRDAYFAQGYLHAKFRLWQMEFQTHAAAGRLCELFGEKLGSTSILDLRDRHFRRLGMVYAAEQSLQLMMQHPEMKEALEAYTEGANAYISKLSSADYPLEYKLLNYAPELWTPLKTALFLKYMSYDLARDFDDIEATNLRNHLGINLYEKVFPVMPDSLDPILPKGTRFGIEAPRPARPAGADTAYAPPLLPASGISVNLPMDHRHPDVGSNNWVVGGSKTASGRPILCNDPHLGLNLPSLWFETQLHLPGYNAYGVNFPGAPGIVIGFNDSIAWGVTNAMRDVMDFYEVQFEDSTMNRYLYNGAWVATEWRHETYKIKDQADFKDKIAMTVWGPVMYDATYGSPNSDNKAIAVRWAAHDPSMEMKTFMLLNRARNYDDYLAAIQHFRCPGQNFVFASKTNDIAWWQQAAFPARWRRQGDFVMPGWDSTYRWQYTIAQEHNIHMVNPERGFVSSANQLPADTLYPYYLGGIHDVYRGKIINRMLAGMQGVTVPDMERMLANNYNIFGEMVRPVLLNHVQRTNLSAEEANRVEQLANWNLQSDIGEAGPVILDLWWREVERAIWKDNLVRPDSLPVAFPQTHTLVEALLRDTAFYFVDNIQTPQKESLSDIVTQALKTVAPQLNGLPATWGAYKATSVRHLLHMSLPAFSRQQLPIGGGRYIINATTETHGPSWRMIVHLSDDTEAYGVYPGGQSGNPGSHFYDMFVDSWAEGKFYPLRVAKTEADAKAMGRWVCNFRPQ